VFIAQELRQKNIVEYLLYMWQVEDIIRAYDCSLSRIRKEYISRFDYSDEQLEDMTDWYGDLVTMMNQEGKRQSGHLQVNQVVLQQLSELHAQLLQSTKFPFYTSQYYKVLPFIVELRNRSGKDKNEIETCLDALYGTMMLRLQNKEITPNTSHAIQEITTLLGMLSDYYKKDKEEGLELE
jgi:flagellin-specific chaperone FliS